jgi:hypothetical protein
MVYFYPERPDLFQQAQILAEELGGRVFAPGLSWKYAWIRTVFGWPMARRAQIALPRLRWSLARKYDKTMLELENFLHPATS